MTSPELLPVGLSGWLVQLADGPAAAALAGHLLERRRLGDPDLRDVAEVVAGARTVLLEGRLERQDVQRLLAGWTAGTGSPGEPARSVQVPVVYDGPDLADVAALTGLGPGEVAAMHAEADFEVAFCGFSPGFAYLTGVPEPLRVPRLDRPRTAVPAGSVALAGEYTGVYPRRSPGGWRLIGRTSLRVWDPAADPPTPLLPGTRVRFVPDPS